MAEILNPFDFVAMEINPSCPNTGHAIQTAETVIESVKAVRDVSRHPIIVKVSVSQDYLAIIKGLSGIAEAVSLNSVPWEMVFPGKRSPLWKLEKKVSGGGGGVSGKPAQALNWKALKELSETGLMPVIGPSIMEYEDIARVRNLGAKAESFGAIHLRTPCKATQIVKQDMFVRSALKCYFGALKIS
jgi:dihydroorotate dehydrogenase